MTTRTGIVMVTVGYFSIMAAADAGPVAILWMVAIVLVFSCARGLPGPTDGGDDVG